MKPLKNDGLFITRKRKKWKFAHFDSYDNCFSHNRGDDPKKSLKLIEQYFDRKKREHPGKIVLEIAAGNARFSYELAKLYPDWNFIAIDIKSDRLYTSAKNALEEGVENIAFLRMHLNELSTVFKKQSIDLIWLTFPDPFPRKRSAKHRLTHQTFLQQYRNILKDTGSLHFKTDNRDLFLWSLEQLIEHTWCVDELSFDLHESALSDVYKIKTFYEERFTALDIPIGYCTARRHDQ